MYVCVYMYIEGMCIRVHMFVMHVETRGELWMPSFIISLLTYSFETGPLTEPRTSEQRTLRHLAPTSQG